MSRYIDADDAINLAKEEIDSGTPNDIAWKLEALPTADVVEVVRCKDCIFGYLYYDVQNGITDSWVECKNPDGLNRDVSVDGYCCASIRRRNENGEIH